MTDVFWIAVGTALFFGTFGYMGWQSWQEEKTERALREFERHMAWLGQALLALRPLGTALVGFGASAVKAAAEFDKLRFIIEHGAGLSLQERTRLRNLIDPT